MLHDRAAYLGNGAGQRDIFGANLHAVLGVAALLNAAVAHQRRQTLALQFFARGMGVEQPHLRDGGRAYEAVSSLNCGQASMQQQQEMQRESGYTASCSSGDTRGPGPRS